MAITYSNTPGTHFESHIVSEVCIDQTDQAGNNTVVVTDDITTSENGQIGDGTWGIGASYVGRLIVINKGTAGIQIRRCIEEAAIGTPTVANSWLLTVHEDWVTNPIETTDQLDIPYETADANDSAASGGIGFTTRTGYFTWTNDVTIDADAGLQILDGTAWELDDNGSPATFVNSLDGYFYSGYQAGEEYINGGLALTVNNVTGEAIYDFQSGCKGYAFDMLFWANLVDSDAYHAGDMEFYGCKWLNGTNELTLYGAKIVNGKGYGKGATTSIVRVDANTVIDGMVVSTVHALDSAADTATETLSNLERVTFSNTTAILTVRQNKTWYLIDPNWSVTTYTDLDWNGTSTLCYVYDQRSVKAIVQKSDGTKLQDALVIIYENTILGDLVVEAVTDVNGEVDDAFTYKLHETNSATTTYGGHALRIDKWLYFPFIADQVSTDKISGSFTIGLDSNISQQTQATAITDGSGIVWSEDTNPSELFDFTLGSGTSLDGMIITFSSGAVGTITELASGDSVAGEIHLKDRNSTAIVNGDTFSRTGGTAGAFSGTYTNDSKQPFSIWLEANAKSYQVQHDYWAARSSETTLNAIGEILHEWGRGQQERVLYKLGDDFYTERSNGKGVYIVNAGAGSVSHYTDDAGNTWSPPATVTLQVTANNQLGTPTAGIKVRYEESDGTLIAQGVTNGSGIFSYGIDAGLLPYNSAKVIVRDKRFEDTPDTILDITTAGFALVIGLQPDRDINLP